METVEELLRQYVRAMADPTRGAILVELEHSDEMTATQLARRLDLTVNNVYHHMRVLREQGVVDPPRSVPGPTYVEKYYRMKPEVRAVVRNDWLWLDRTQRAMTPQERQALFVGSCLAMAHLLHQAARRYAAMDAQTLEALTYTRGYSMTSINELSHARYVRRLASLREMLVEENEDFPAPDDHEGNNVVVMAALPFFWGDDEGGEATAEAAREDGEIGGE